MNHLCRLMLLAGSLLVISPLAGASCESVHSSNLGVCRSEYQPQCSSSTNYANQYCNKSPKSVEDRQKCSRYSSIRDQKCAAMGSCRRQAEAAFNTCKAQRAAAAGKKR